MKVINFLNIIIRKITNHSKILNKIIVNRFHHLYFDSFKTTLRNSFWLGVPIVKCPLDTWIFQEIIYSLKPDVIVECGTSRGGSSMYFASLCDLIDNGRIITIDIKKLDGVPQHKRIKCLVGSSISNEVIDQVKNLISERDKVMVMLDSSHEKNHVLNELRIYSKMVTIGSYIIVEDTNVNGHPVLPNHGPGPMEAVEIFLKENKNFKVDKTREKFLMTFNPNGYLKRIK